MQPAVLQLEAPGAAQAVAGRMRGRVTVLAIARGAWRGCADDCELQLRGALRGVPRGRDGGCPPSPPAGRRSAGRPLHGHIPPALQADGRP